MSPARSAKVGTERLTALVDGLVGRGAVSAVQIAWRRGDEVSGIAAGDCDERSRFALASLTKPLTAVACLVAAEEGLLALDDPLRRFVPEAACDATLRELLSHAGGLPADDAAARRVQLDPAAGWPEVADAYAAVSPIAAPRERRIYSNAGYALAALALERAADRSYRDWIQVRVLDPLGMAATRFGDDGTAVPVREPGLLGHGEQLFNGERFRALGLPQSGAYGTAADCLRLLDAIAGRGTALLGAEARAAMLANQCGALAGGVQGFMEWERCDWAVGLDLRDGKTPHWTGSALSAAAATHFGASGTLAFLDPDADVAAVVLANRGTYSGWMLEPGGWPDICAALVAQRAGVGVQRANTPAR